MPPSHSLQLALFRRQKADIDRVVEGRSKTFDDYEARYRRHTRSFRRAVSLADVQARVGEADVVYVGDYHTLAAAQQRYAQLVEVSARGDRPVVMALEFFEARHQKWLDAYLLRRISLDALAEHTGHPSARAGLFANLAPLLRLARQLRLPVLAIDRRVRGADSLASRDAFAAERIVSALNAPEHPRVMVLVGQFHVAPPHLPRAVLDRATQPPRTLTVYQNCEALYWTLARTGRLPGTDAVELSTDAVCLIHTSPVLCQQSYLDYLEAEADDALLSEHSVAERFRQIAQLLARELQVEVKAPLQQLQIATAGEPDLLELVARRGQYTGPALRALRAQLLSRESCYLPKARVAYLASLSLNHAAEEAAHFVRHACVGPAMETPRPAAEDFYARCVEEALGFFGSRLINPQRHCPSLAEWSALFQDGTRQEKRSAAFVLAHKASELESSERAQELAPTGPPALRNEVAHGLGYLLGDALHRAYERGALSRTRIRQLFRDPLADPQGVYFELADRFLRAEGKLRRAA